MSKELLKHSLIYSVAQIFIMFAGLISFPVLTKNLSPEEYGVIGLFTVTISFVVAFGKLGLQHSILRYREDYEESTFIANLVFLCMLGPVFISIMLVIISMFIFSSFQITLVDHETVLIIIALGFSEQIRGLVLNYFISTQKSPIVAKIKILNKTICVIFTLSAILFIIASAKSFMYALLAAEIIVFVVSLKIAFKQKMFTNLKIANVKATIYKPMLIFGLPLLGLEMVNIIHAFTDRYLIKYFMEDKYLGFYSAYYNMSTIISQLIIGGLALAIIPAYMKIWNEHGREKTEALLSKVFNLMLLICPILIASLYVVSKELFTLLTTSEYVTFSYLLPILTAGVLIHAALPIYSAGLKLRKSSMTMFYCVIISALINISLNVVFIPKFGLIAAAVSTIVSYSFILFSFLYLGSKTLTISLDLKVLVRSCIHGLIFIFISSFLHVENNTSLLVMKILLGFMYFSFVLLILEKTQTALIINMILRRKS